MKIFDAHHHIGSLQDVSFDKSLEQKVSHHTRIMDRYNISSAVLMPSPTYPNPNGVDDTRAINDSMATLRDLHTDRFPVAFGTVEPWYGEAGLQEIDRMLESLDGIMWHNRWQRCFVDSPMIYDYIERAAKHDAIVGLHAYSGSELTSPWRVFNVTKSFPEIQFIVYDALGSVAQTQEIINRGVDLQLDNVVFDTALAPRLATQLPAFIEEFGVNRVVFGTDVYTDRDTPYTTRPIDQFHDAGLPEAHERAILHKNAVRVFDLD